MMAKSHMKTFCIAAPLCKEAANKAASLHRGAVMQDLMFTLLPKAHQKAQYIPQ